MRLFTFKQIKNHPYDPYAETRYSYVLESIDGAQPISPIVGDNLSWKIIENIIANGNAVLIVKED